MMNTVTIHLDRHNVTREDAAALVENSWATTNLESFAGYAVLIDAEHAEVIEDAFSDELVRLALVQMSAESLNVVGGSEAILREFNFTTSVWGVQQKLLINGSPAKVQPHRAVSTEVFAANVADQIAYKHGRSPIAGVFAEELTEHGVQVQAEQLAVMANQVTKLILSDKNYDSEANMARRAVTRVLTERFGNTVSVNGPWLVGELVTINRQRHRITGQPCPGCITSPECKGEGRKMNYCPACGWFEMPF